MLASSSDTRTVVPVPSGYSRILTLPALSIFANNVMHRKAGAGMADELSGPGGNIRSHSREMRLESIATVWLRTEAEIVSADDVPTFASSMADQFLLQTTLKMTSIVRKRAYPHRTRCAMTDRRSFKTDESFLEIQAIGVFPSCHRKSFNIPFEIEQGMEPHPLRFAEMLPGFFIASVAQHMGRGGWGPGEGGSRSYVLGDPITMVLNLFTSSKTTGSDAEKRGRRCKNMLTAFWSLLQAHDLRLGLNQQPQRQLVLTKNQCAHAPLTTRR